MPKKISKREWKGIVITSIVFAILTFLAMQTDNEVLQSILIGSASFTFLALLIFVMRELFGVKIFRR